MKTIESDNNHMESFISLGINPQRVETSIELIVNERRRQIEQEGWTPDHDDKHDGNQIAMAAACYASPVPLRAHIEVSCGCREASCQHPFGVHKWVEAWPWDKNADKRVKLSRIRQLVIAAALCAAEIDRLQRNPAEEEAGG